MTLKPTYAVYNMDIFIYVAILVIMGAIRVGKTSQVSEDSGIVDTGATVIMSGYDDIPIGGNLALKKERCAYTLILEELGLM